MAVDIKDKKYKAAMEYFNFKKIPTIEDVESAKYWMNKKHPLSINDTLWAYDTLMKVALQGMCPFNVSDFMEVVNEDTFTYYKAGFLASLEEKYSKVPTSKGIVENEVLYTDIENIVKELDNALDYLYAANNIKDFQDGYKLFYKEYQKLYNQYICDYADSLYAQMKKTNPNNDQNDIIYATREEAMVNPFSASLVDKNQNMYDKTIEYIGYKDQVTRLCGKYFYGIECELKRKEYADILSKYYSEIDEVLDDLSDKAYEDIKHLVVKKQEDVMIKYKEVISFDKLDLRLFIKYLEDNVEDDLDSYISQIKNKAKKYAMRDKLDNAINFDDYARLNNQVEAAVTRGR